MTNEVAKKRFDTIPEHPTILGKAPLTGSDESLEAIFVDHVKTIAAINTARGIKTIFVGQMFNKESSQGPNVWAPLVKKGDFLPLQERFNSILRDAAEASSAKYIDPGIDNFAKTDFVDLGHFTASGARKFGTLIAKDVDAYCQLPMLKSPAGLAATAAR